MIETHVADNDVNETMSKPTVASMNFQRTGFH